MTSLTEESGFADNIEKFSEEEVQEVSSSLGIRHLPTDAFEAWVRIK